MNLEGVPQRAGSRPATTTVNPHTQLDQNAPKALQDRVRDFALALPGVRRGRSSVSVPGTVAFLLDAPTRRPEVPDLFGGEFGHLHPFRDGSLHLTLPQPVAEFLIDRGWAEFHNVVRAGLVPPILVMAYGPRDEGELAVVCGMVARAHHAAGGDVADSAGVASD